MANSGKSLRRMVFLLAMVPAVALAEADARDRIVSEMAADGLTHITIRKTLLGRTRIIGTDGDRTRAVVLNEKTGKVIKDINAVGVEADTPDGTGLAY